MINFKERERAFAIVMGMMGVGAKGSQRPIGTDQRMHMMEQRIDMMQTMMEQMMHHQRMLPLTPAK